MSIGIIFPHQLIEQSILASSCDTIYLVEEFLYFKHYNFHKKKIKNFDETHAEILTNRFIQKITTQFVKHLKEEETSVNDSIQIMSKVFGKS